MKKGRTGALVGIIVVLLILLLGIIIFLLIRGDVFPAPLAAAPSQQYGQATIECRDVIVPYQTTEEYIDLVPFTVLETRRADFRYSSIGWHRSIIRDSKEYEQGIVEVRNLEDEDREFTVIMHFLTDDGTIRRRLSKTVFGDDSETFEASVQVNADDIIRWRYEVLPERKSRERIRTEYREVLRTRTIIRYQTEQRCS